MIDQRGGALIRLLLLGLVMGGAWFVAKKWWPHNQPNHLVGRVGNALAKELTLQGITDQDVLSQVRTEHSFYGLTWIETSRSILVKDEAHLKAVAAGISRVAKQEGCSFAKHPVPAGVEIRLKWFFLLVERLSLVSAPAHERPGKRKNPRVAFVIDDVAYEMQPMERFASLGVPLTFAILPRSKHARELSERATALHFPVMLHLPMEPQDKAHNDPGPSGMYLTMTDQELRSQFEKNVASVPNLVGINNHMGSAFTENESKMTLVMTWMKPTGLYFLDSRTSIRSVACNVARKVGVPCLSNETFLDNEDELAAIERQLDTVLALALKRGQTVAIGHYRRKYLVQALANKLPEFKSRGVQIVTLPTFYKR